MTPDDDDLVITLAITAHGCVTTMDIDPDNEHNVRYTSITNDNLDTTISSHDTDVRNIYSLNRYFRKDTPDKIQSNLPYFDSLPYDKAFSGVSDMGLSAFNMLFSTIARLPTNLGIWVISVHKRREPQPTNNYEYVFPKDTDQLTNLLNLNGLELLNRTFNNIPNLKDTIKKEDKNIKLNGDNTRIESIRLSYLLKLLKQIMGPKCDFNIYDFSCSSPCNGSSIIDTKTTTSLIHLPEAGDPESGRTRFFGGKRKNRKTKRRRSRRYMRPKRKYTIKKTKKMKRKRKH